MSIHITRLEHVCRDNREEPRDGRDDIVASVSPIVSGSTELKWRSYRNPNDPATQNGIKFCPFCEERLPRTLRDARYQAVTMEGGIQ